MHASQYRVFNDPARFRVLAAGRRFGKTILAVVILLHEAVSKPNMRCWYLAPYYRQAKTIAWDIMLKLIPDHIIAKKNEVDLEIRLKNGSEICLKGADNSDSLVGVGLNFCVLDEFALYKRDVWEKIVRPMLSDTLGKALFISTPRGKNQFWELFVKGERKENGYSSYKFGTEDNPYIERSEIKEAKDQLNERYFRQEYLASFEDYTGLIWPEFEQKHVIEPFELPTNWEKIGTLDPAVTGTTASLQAAIDEDGQLFVFSEYYEQNKRANEVADVIKGRASTWYGDPAGKIRSVSRNGVLFSLFDEYSESGLYLLPAQNDVSAGINRVAEFFKANKIKVFKTCKNLIHELERYHWSEERETALGIMEPKPYKSLDHLCFGYSTLVRMADGSVKKIGEIKSGDLVMTPIGGQAVLWSGVIRLRSAIECVIIGNQLMEVTDDHEFAVSKRDEAGISRESVLPMREVFFKGTGERKRLLTQDGVGTFQRKGSKGISYPSFGRESGEQFSSESCLCENSFPLQLSHEQEGTDRDESCQYQESYCKSSGMAQVARGQGVALDAHERDRCIVDLQKVQLRYLRKTIRESIKSKTSTAFLRVKLQDGKLQKKSSELSTEILQEKPRVISSKIAPVFCLQVPCGWFVLANGLIAKNCDCLRYLVMSREEPSKAYREPMKKFSDADFERMERQQHQLEEV